MQQPKRSLTAGSEMAGNETAVADSKGDCGKQTVGRKLSAGSIAALIVGAVVLGAAVYIMVNGLGLNPDLDFGAGAYYYADIPDYQQTLDWDSYTARLPFVVYLLLFLAWGFLMWRIWKRLDRKQ